VAVLCNTNVADPSRYAHQIADLVLADKLKDLRVVKAVVVPPEFLERIAGVYRETSTDAVLRVVWDPKSGALRAGGQALVPTGPASCTRRMAPAGSRPSGDGRMTSRSARSWRRPSAPSRAGGNPSARSSRMRRSFTGSPANTSARNSASHTPSTLMAAC